jgi:hypothetical protein
MTPRALESVMLCTLITPNPNHGRYLDGCLEIVSDFRMQGADAWQRHPGRTRDMVTILAAGLQHIESRAIRRAYGVTLFVDPYLNGLVDGILWLAAKGWKAVKKSLGV